MPLLLISYLFLKNPVKTAFRFEPTRPRCHDSFTDRALNDDFGAKLVLRASATRYVVDPLRISFGFWSISSVNFVRLAFCGRFIASTTISSSLSPSSRNSSGRNSGNRLSGPNFNVEVAAIVEPAFSSSSSLSSRDRFRPDFL
jgi:hypothetical protein